MTPSAIVSKFDSRTQSLLDSSCSSSFKLSRRYRCCSNEMLSSLVSISSGHIDFPRLEALFVHVEHLTYHM
ncbi:hypothetical protein PENTCL1PPCAC_23198 [Pristionchus entomophagus]|uniref:Uncharacterized protein n=1 Tax=Pristionchus entomophagus TaxID=358040 RepID=A0AAV5U2H1_9BILA|nr:hypothetical protein PENTCL1PPCAC_23198 [Pristionchus entomophagus]